MNWISGVGKVILPLVLVVLSSHISIGQNTIGKDDLKHVITTGVPFMRIATDARSGGMAEVGVSTSADNSSGFHNPAKFSFVKNDLESVTQMTIQIVAASFPVFWNVPMQ